MTSPANGIDRVDDYIADLPDWRGPRLDEIRRAILEVDPEIIEEWKWMGSPCWSRDGLIAVGNAHKTKIKLTFNYGARLDDPAHLFNGNDTGATRRSIDIFENDALDLKALQNLVRASIAYNHAHLKKNAGKG